MRCVFHKNFALVEDDTLIMSVNKDRRHQPHRQRRSSYLCSPQPPLANRWDCPSSIPGRPRSRRRRQDNSSHCPLRRRHPARCRQNHRLQSSPGCERSTSQGSSKVFSLPRSTRTHLNYWRALQDLFHSTVGPLRDVTLHYDAAGRSKGVASVHFQKRGDGTKAYQTYNNRLIDGS